MKTYSSAKIATLNDSFSAACLMAILGANPGNRFCVIAPAAKATAMRPGQRDGLGQFDIGFQLDGADCPLFLAQF